MWTEKTATATFGGSFLRGWPMRKSGKAMKKAPTDTFQTFDELPAPKVDHARLAATTDEDIRRQIAEDPDTAPELDDEWFDRARVVEPVLKGIAISLRVPPDVLEWYKAQG